MGRQSACCRAAVSCHSSASPAVGNLRTAAVASLSAPCLTCKANAAKMKLRGSPRKYHAEPVSWSRLKTILVCVAEHGPLNSPRPGYARDVVSYESRLAFRAFVWGVRAALLTIRGARTKGPTDTTDRARALLRLPRLCARPNFGLFINPWSAHATPKRPPEAGRPR